MNKDKDLFEMSKRIAMHVTQADDPCDGMAEIVQALFDDKTPGEDMLKILTGAIVFMVKTLDTAAHSTLAALVPPLVLLYPGKSPEEIISIAVELLKPESRRMHVERHVFIFHKRGE